MTSARAGILSALPDIGFAGVFLITWIRPSTFGPFMVKWLLGVILGQGQDLGQRAVVMAGWAASTAFYLLGCFATVLLPIPRFGITAEVVAAQRIPGGGLWVEHPEKVNAFGVIYFGLTAWSELHAHRWAAKVSTAATLAKPGSR